MSERILVAVDDSEASQKALEYVSDWILGRPECFVHLVHVLPPAPVSVIEAVEAGTDAYGRWMTESKKAGQAVLARMRARLTEAGLDEEHVDAGFLSVGLETSIGEGLLDAARDQRCVTVVVGRNSLPWYKELVHRHPADELVRKAKGFTLWIVE